MEYNKTKVKYSTDIPEFITRDTIVNNLGRVQGTRWFQIVMPDNRVGFIYDTLVAPWDGSELQAWAIAQGEGTINAYQTYLRDHPQGPNAETAKNNIVIPGKDQTKKALKNYPRS